MNTLNDDDKTKVKQWLRSLGGTGEGFRCSACNAGQLMEPSLIVSMPEAESIRVIPLTCDSCARVTFLDAKPLGI